MIIAVVNTKGGVGKTSTAMLMAEAAGRAGYTSVVLDADPQGSASEWAEIAQDEMGGIKRFAVTSVNRANLAKVAGRATEDWVFIDTPTGDATAITAAAEIADFVIIPTSPKPGDFHRALQTYNAISSAPAGLLFCHWNKRSTKNFADAQAIVEEQDISAFISTVPNREAIDRFWFSDPSTGDLQGYQDAFTELSQALKNK